MKGDAEVEGAYFRYPRKEQLFLSRSRTQQCAIAATHQRESGLSQANGSVAQIVGSPIAFGNALRAVYDFGDFPVGGAIYPRVEGAERERVPAAAMRGKRMQRFPRWPAIESPPQAPARIQAKVEVAVERKFDRIGDGNDRRLFQPDAMLYALETQYRMPTVRALPELALVQVAEIQADVRVRADERRGPYRNDRRQSLRRPEDRLLNERLIRIGCEKPTPSVGGTRHLR